MRAGLLAALPPRQRELRRLAPRRGAAGPARRCRARRGRVERRVHRAGRRPPVRHCGRRTRSGPRPTRSTRSNFDAATALAARPHPAEAGDVRSPTRSRPRRSATWRSARATSRATSAASRSSIAASARCPAPCVEPDRGHSRPRRPARHRPAATKIKALAGDDRVTGGDGDDCLIGGAGEDRLRGGNGADKVRGGPGRRPPLGGKGDDTMNARGQGRDLVRCGPGDDTAKVDRKDRTKGCENVQIANGV